MRWAIVGATVWVGDATVVRHGLVVADGERVERVGPDGLAKGARAVRAGERCPSPGCADAYTPVGGRPQGPEGEGEGSGLSAPTEPRRPQLPALRYEAGRTVRRARSLRCWATAVTCAARAQPRARAHRAAARAMAPGEAASDRLGVPRLGLEAGDAFSRRRPLGSLRRVCRAHVAGEWLCPA